MSSLFFPLAQHTRKNIRNGKGEFEEQEHRGKTHMKGCRSDPSLAIRFMYFNYFRA